MPIDAAGICEIDRRLDPVQSLSHLSRRPRLSRHPSPTAPTPRSPSPRTSALAAGALASTPVTSAARRHPYPFFAPLYCLYPAPFYLSVLSHLPFPAPTNPPTPFFSFVAI